MSMTDPVNQRGEDPTVQSTYVLDASFFLYALTLPGTLYTTPGVSSELRDLRSRARLETLLAEGLCIHDPLSSSVLMVTQAAEQSGDLCVLSPADISVLASAVDLSGIIVSDDFALHNVAHHLGLTVLPIMQRRAKKWRWEYVCTGCRATKTAGDVCLICGCTVVRRRVK